MSTVLNIIAGNATLKVGTLAQVEGSALDVGTLEGGVALEMTREYYDVKADDFLGVVRKHKIGEMLIVKMQMAEATLANLAVAFDYPAGAVAGSVLSFGGDKTATERTLYINGDGVGGGTRKITLHKCVQVGTAAHAYKKGEKTMIEIEFHVLEDTSQTANERFGTIEDTSADTTAPTIVLTTPADGGTVTKDAKGTVLWTFTEAGTIDENTLVYGNTVVILNTTTPATASLEAGTIVYDKTAKTITFTPTNNWNGSDTLQAIITTGVKDMAGNALAATKIEQFSVTA